MRGLGEQGRVGWGRAKLPGQCMRNTCQRFVFLLCFFFNPGQKPANTMFLFFLNGNTPADRTSRNNNEAIMKAK